MSRSVCWNLTNICNRACEYCFRELTEESQDLETNLAILSNLKLMGVERITFSGGEPLCYPYLNELVEAAYQMGFTCQLVTNAKLLDENNIPDLFKYMSKVSFSCDSPRAYINEKIGRGEDSYDCVKKVIDITRKYFSKEELKIDINTVVTYDPTREYRELDYMLDAIRNELLNFNIDNWKIIRFYPLRGRAKQMEKELSIPEQDFIEIKGVYSMNSSYINIDVRDIKELDENLIVSPQGYLKKSSNGVEIVLGDLKPPYIKKGSAGRVQ